jgi:hypothetical protein
MAVRVLSDCRDHQIRRDLDMAIAEIPQRRPIWQRLFFAIPVLGWVARDLARDTAGNLWFAIIFFVSLWACAVLTFGLPGLFVPALIMVPVIWAILLLITRG